MVFVVVHNTVSRDECRYIAAGFPGAGTDRFPRNLFCRHQRGGGALFTLLGPQFRRQWQATSHHKSYIQLLEVASCCVRCQVGVSALVATRLFISRPRPVAVAGMNCHKPAAPATIRHWAQGRTRLPVDIEVRSAYMAFECLLE